MEIIFHSSNDEFPVIRREFQVLMVQQTGSRTARFTVTDVFYRFEALNQPDKLWCGIKNHACRIPQCASHKFSFAMFTLNAFLERTRMRFLLLVKNIK